MAKDYVINRYLTGTLTQGSADAFVQVALATGIVPSDGMALLVTQIEVVFEPGQLAAISTDSAIFLSATRDTKTAWTNYDDPDSVWADAVAYSITTSGAAFIDAKRVYAPPNGIVVVEPNLYVQLDSTTTGQTLVAAVRAQYEMVKVSEIDILRLLNNTNA